MPLNNLISVILNVIGASSGVKVFEYGKPKNHCRNGPGIMQYCRVVTNVKKSGNFSRVVRGIYNRQSLDNARLG